MTRPDAVAVRADLEIPRPFLVFMGDVPDRGAAHHCHSLVQAVATFLTALRAGS